MRRMLAVNRHLVVLMAAAVLGAAAAPASAGFYHSEEVKPLWIKMDLDGDGYVSEDEVRAQDPRMMKRFYRADHNRDGRLDLLEFEMLLISL